MSATQVTALSLANSVEGRARYRYRTRRQPGTLDMLTRLLRRPPVAVTHALPRARTARALHASSALRAIDMAKVDTTERLAELRRLMRERNVDVYMVPSEDSHQSEYIAPCDARRGQTPRTARSPRAPN
jgi:hypothetical protein